jgi:hypothetical protein
MKEVANFFWQGIPLSLYEQLCIKSFIKHGFEVNIWSFMDLKIPEGATLRNAREIISPEHLFKYTQAGKPGNIAAFSDVFRFTLMLKKPGEWWFDSDCICLMDASEYTKLKEDKKIVVAYENANQLSIGIGALTIPDMTIAHDLLIKQKEICDTVKDIPWGDIGPKLVTNYCRENDMEDQFLPVEVFYPISYFEWYHIYEVKLTKILLDRVKTAHMTHLWNEVLGGKVDKNEVPAKDTFMYVMFERYFPEALQEDTE